MRCKTTHLYVLTDKSNGNEIFTALETLVDIQTSTTEMKCCKMFNKGEKSSNLQAG